MHIRFDTHEDADGETYGLINETAAVNLIVHTVATDLPESRGWIQVDTYLWNADIMCIQISGCHCVTKRSAGMKGVYERPTV